MLRIMLGCCLLATTLMGMAQTFPAKENGSFQTFQPNATGRSDVNAYWLSYLSRVVYVQYLNLDNGYTLRLTDTSRFREKFIERTRHFFRPVLQTSTTTINKQIVTSPTNLGNTNLAAQLPSTFASNNDVQYRWIWKSDGRGKNPEAMVISTPTSVLVVFRGTDRVEGGNDFDHDWGEWIYTDFNVWPQRPCSNCNVRVHKGFYEALMYADFKRDLVNTLREFGSAQKKVWVTGHSLGGGMAQLFAYIARKVDNIDIQGVYVYNSPHPGDDAFASEMDVLFPNQRLQRFEFLSDPISSGPPQSINWMPSVMRWGRAGIRNWFSKETSGGYRYNANEKPAHEDVALFSAVGGLLNMGGMCFHHPTWITRATYNLLPADLQAKVPTAPARNKQSDEGCNVLDINQGTSGHLHDGGTDNIAAGTYLLKNVRSNRYLQASSNCGINGCCDLRQDDSNAGSDVRWRVARVPNAIFAGYTFTSTMNEKVVDADMGETGKDGGKVHLCGRLPVAVGLRTHQEWKLERLENGNYRIRCVAGNRYLRVAPGCSSQDGCRFELWERPTPEAEWILIKVG